MTSNQQPTRRGIGLKAEIPSTDIPGSPTAIRLPLTSIRMDDAIQQRAQTDHAIVDEYAERIREWIHLAPPTVFGSLGQYWLADGFHRLAAAQRSGLEVIPAIVKPGTRRDALLFATAANATHGLRRTNTDKRRAVETLLQDPEGEWSQWGDRRIADHVGVSHTFVANRRKQLATVASGETPTPSGTGSDGEQALVDVSDDSGSPERSQPDIAQPQGGSPSSVACGLNDAEREDSDLNHSPASLPLPALRKRLGKDGKTRSLPQTPTSTRADLDGLAKRLDTLANRYGREQVVGVLRSWIETQEGRP